MTHRLKDKKRSGQPKVFEDEDFEALLIEDHYQTLKKLFDRLNVTEMAVREHLHNLRLVQKVENC